MIRYLLINDRRLLNPGLMIPGNAVTLHIEFAWRFDPLMCALRAPLRACVFPDRLMETIEVPVIVQRAFEGNGWLVHTNVSSLGAGDVQETDLVVHLWNDLGNLRGVVMTQETWDNRRVR